MALQATFRHGEPEMIDYTPTTASVNTGDVVVLAAAGGLTCGVAHHDIPQNAQGALACDGGIYDVKNINNAANYTKVYWDATNLGVTTTATSNALFGFITANGGGGANSLCRARHHPFV